MYPQTAMQALRYLKSMFDCDYVDFAIERECYGATPYLYAKTSDGQWVIVWHVDQISD